MRETETETETERTHTHKTIIGAADGVCVCAFISFRVASPKQVGDMHSGMNERVRGAQAASHANDTRRLYRLSDGSACITLADITCSTVAVLW